MQRGFRVVVIGLLVLAAILAAAPVGAVAPGTAEFTRTWERADRPVAELRVSRTWMWGPQANSELLWEPYLDAPNGLRRVQYFDKSRMEDSAYLNPAAPWDVTNGLLARELLTGQLQLGDDLFLPRLPAEINVAGDPDDATGVTYATFRGLTDDPSLANSAVVTHTVDHNGHVLDGGALGQLLAGYGVTALDVGAPTGHTVASVFWQFVTSSGLVYESGSYGDAALFQNPFYATGYPLTEPYWTIIRVGGVGQRVLVQVFERRVLTYTPDNPDGWKVEAGNVGQHYYQWRYGALAVAHAPLDLGTLGGDGSSASGINYLGQVVGVSTRDDGEQHAFFWWGGELEDLGTLGGDWSQANALNDHGEIVGISETATGEQHATLWYGGKVIDLGHLGGGFSFATAINHDGQIVGVSSTTDGQLHGFLWVNGRMIDLGGLSGGFSQTSAISNNGVIVGRSLTSTGAMHATLWP